MNVPCSHDPERWFSTDEHDQRYAREVCHYCPVKDACRTEMDRIESNLLYSQWGGIIAGESVRERYRRRKRAGWVRTKVTGEPWRVER